MTSQRFFPEYGGDYSFSAFEEKVMGYWNAGGIFKRSLENSTSKPQYFFYDGPQFATGLPHYGHLVGGTIKDIVPRYWSMRGYHVPRRFGWDCHGLPVEFEIEKSLNLKGSLDIIDFGIAKFNEACREIVLRYTQDWRKVVERMGRWVDMDNDYKTMDPKFMESVWWVFSELWRKGLVYQGNKVVPYSWRLTAALSNFEASLNYKDVQDPAITVVLPLLGEKFAKTGLAVWTTTPWTLPSNLAVAIHADAKVVDYGIYKLEKPLENLEFAVIANALAERAGLKEKVRDVSSSELLGQHYQPLFTTFQDAERQKQNAFRVIDGSKLVTATDGTGLVHMAPAFGEDDFYICKAAGIELVDPTDVECKFTSDVARDARLKDVVGLFVKDADKAIIKVLKDSHRLLKQETLQHSYPFCYRSDQPLIYKAISSWYVNVEKVKEQMLKNNAEINWVPDHIQSGRFGKWLENARDWCVSRNRFWGTPIPIWVNEKDSSDCIVIGSREELEKFAGRPMPDLHKHFVDDIVIERDGKRYRRTPEVLDCWFESGSMPYAQEHYPFENKKSFEEAFPANFIAEGIDQTRGWFYTLTVLSTALFGKPAFKNCIVNGMVLAEDGKKMSKSLKNYPDPSEVFNKYGADALRLYLMQSPATHAEELRFSERGLVELMRAVMIPLWNAYSFFASYANIDGWKPEDVARAPAVKDRPRLDQWILARVKEAEVQIHEKMQAYLLYEVAPIQIQLVDDLTNWYIRLNRDRFWSENDAATESDKLAAYATLWTVLDRMAMLLAPSLPFISETMHAALRGLNVNALAEHPTAVSIHEKDYGAVEGVKLSPTEENMILETDLAKKVILLGRSLRGEVKIGLRQPLKLLRVAGLSENQQKHLNAVRDLICQEVNVKSLEMVNKASDLVEESVKPNFRTLGKKAGPKMKDLQKEILAWGATEIATFEKSKKAVVLGIECGSEDIEIVRKAKDGRSAQAGYGLVAELDIELTSELLFEGMQREIVNRVQQRRKEMQLHLADRVEVSWKALKGELLTQVLKQETAKAGLISSETLAVKFVEKNVFDDGTTVDIGDVGSFVFELRKV
ncbi:MAG: isoleucine--tRNA ligase [Bdellovibrionota bacterium]